MHFNPQNNDILLCIKWKVFRYVCVQIVLFEHLNTPWYSLVILVPACLDKWLPTVKLWQHNSAMATREEGLHICSAELLVGTPYYIFEKSKTHTVHCTHAHTLKSHVLSCGILWQISLRSWNKSMQTHSHVKTGQYLGGGLESLVLVSYVKPRAHKNGRLEKDDVTT